MSQSIVLTGANRGLGLELARAFTGRGDTVIVMCTTGPNQVTPSCTSWNDSSKVVVSVTSGARIAKVKRPVVPGA